jgi:hypothetical protein
MRNSRNFSEKLKKTVVMKIKNTIEKTCKKSLALNFPFADLSARKGKNSLSNLSELKIAWKS